MTETPGSTARLAEQPAHNRKTVGSTPIAATISEEPLDPRRMALILRHDEGQIETLEALNQALVSYREVLMDATEAIMQDAARPAIRETIPALAFLRALVEGATFEDGETRAVTLHHLTTVEAGLQNILHAMHMHHPFLDTVVASHESNQSAGSPGRGEVNDSGGPVPSHEVGTLQC